MNLKDIQKLVYEEYYKNGYADFWDKATCFYPDCNKINALAEVCGFTSEIGELFETIFSKGVEIDNKRNMAEECADIVIRIMNFCSRFKINLENAILAKHERNLKRGKLHGKTE